MQPQPYWIPPASQTTGGLVMAPSQTNGGLVMAPSGTPQQGAQFHPVMLQSYAGQQPLVPPPGKPFNQINSVSSYPVHGYPSMPGSQQPGGQIYDGSRAFVGPAEPPAGLGSAEAGGTDETGTVIQLYWGLDLKPEEVKLENEGFEAAKKRFLSSQPTEQLRVAGEAGKVDRHCHLGFFGYDLLILKRPE
eukprot:260962-Rhodomonas_salina.1